MKYAIKSICLHSKTICLIYRMMKINSLLLTMFILPSIAFSQSIDNSTDVVKNKSPEVIFYVNLNVMLEGAYDGNKMLANLNKAGLLPLGQPFNTSPWNYDGTESVESIPNGNVVDWVYVELRNGLAPEEATSETTFGKQAAFLLSSGKVVGTDGSSALLFDTTYT